MVFGGGGGGGSVENFKASPTTTVTPEAKNTQRVCIASSLLRLRNVRELCIVGRPWLLRIDRLGKHKRRLDYGGAIKQKGKSLAKKAAEDIHYKRR